MNVSPSESAKFVLQVALEESDVVSGFLWFDVLRGHLPHHKFRAIVKICI